MTFQPEPRLISQFQVVDDHDNPLSNVCAPADIDRVAEGIATDRQAIVYYYTLNGMRVEVTPRPTVGLACTICYITDRHAATVIEVSPSGRRVRVKEDRATRTDDNGPSDSQSYTYERNPVGQIHTFYRDAHGKYRNRGSRLVLGIRRSFHDYSY